MLLSLLAAMLLASCSDEAGWTAEEGTLRVALADVSDAVQTRSTPSELGAPALENFRINISNTEGRRVYSKPYSTADIHLAAGSYTVEAVCGDNPAIGYDAPYYTGSASAEVASEGVTEASIACKVSNALVSVRFGRDDAERARFDKFYRNYALQVWNGDKSASITSIQPGRSAYFPAGSSIRLAFTGTLRGNDRVVNTTLDPSGTGFPSVFQAADHAIVTLSLPDPECVTAVEISKVELVEATVAGTIPLDWLPTPVATASHVYNAQGLLTGTDITFNNAYPGMTWKAVLTDNSGNTVRTVEGTGALESRGTDNAEGWPYVPTGTYTATYYVMMDGAMQQTKTANVSVGKPNITVSTDAYTSYSKYLAGEVDAANACNAYTVYAPLVKVNISRDLILNSRYSCSLTVKLNDNAISEVFDDNDMEYADQTNLTPSFDAYTLSASVTFDKTTATANKDLYITGLPASWTPPTEGDWAVSGTHEWNGNYNDKDCVRLGQNTGSNPQYIYCNLFAIPAGVKIEAPYDVMTQGATVATTLSLSLGNDTYFSQKSRTGTEFTPKRDYYEGTATFTLSANASQAKANNSYGLAQTCSRIYSLSYYYGK